MRGTALDINTSVGKNYHHLRIMEGTAPDNDSGSGITSIQKEDAKDWFIPVTYWFF